MITFASKVKKECTLLELHFEHAKAELAALVIMGGQLNFYNDHYTLNIQSENPTIARRIYTLLKEHFDMDNKVIVRRKMTFKKNNVYIVRCDENVLDLLSQLEALSADGEIIDHVPESILNDEQKARSYLRGAFLAAGSVNHPESNSYHLEIYSATKDHNLGICQLMNMFGLNAKTVNRRNGYISYIKEAEKISDFLAAIGASSALLEFEDVRIVRDLRNSVNRLVNCENANMNKTIDASQRQIEAIKKIDRIQGLASLPEKLQEVAHFRLENPDMSLKELGEQMPSGKISKSAVNHRLRKIIDIAEEI